MNYHCDFCNYDAKRKEHFQKHLKTKKHIKNTKKLDNLEFYKKSGNQVLSNIATSSTEKWKHLTCKYCGQTFKRLDGLTKHSSRCNYVLKENYELKLKEQNITKQKEHLESEVERLKEDVEYYKRILENGVESFNKTISVLSLANIYFDGAPQLENPTKDQMLIFGKEIPKKLSNYKKKLLLEKSKEDKSPEHKKDFQTYRNLTYEYGKGRDKRNDNINREKCKTFLATYIANGIKLLYQAEDPKDQAFWSTDASRYNFIIKEAKWKDDNNGEKIKEKLISVILNDIKEILQRELKREMNINNNHMLGKGNISKLRFDETVRDIPRASYIIDDIDNGSLETLIMKKLAKHFKVDKDYLIDLKNVLSKKKVTKKLKNTTATRKNFKVIRHKKNFED